MSLVYIYVVKFVFEHFNVAKCNLGEVNLEAMLVSSFSSYSGDGPMPLAGAPRDFVYPVACLQFLAKCFAIGCCLCTRLFFGFSHPSLPFEVRVR